MLKNSRSDAHEKKFNFFAGYRIIEFGCL
jgi:hypothetical protein